NVLEGTIESDGCHVGSAVLPVPEKLGASAGRRVAVGIRPEALGLPGGDDRPRLRGRIATVEALGPEQLAHVEIEASPVLAEEVLEGLVDSDDAKELAEIVDEHHATVIARLDASATLRPDDQ